MYDDCNIMWKNTGMVYVSEDDYGKLLDSRSHSTEPKIQKLWYNCLCLTILIYEIIWASFQYVCICLWVVWYMDAVLTGWYDYCLVIKIVQVHVNLCVHNTREHNKMDKHTKYTSTWCNMHRMKYMLIWSWNMQQMGNKQIVISQCKYTKLYLYVYILMGTLQILCMCGSITTCLYIKELMDLERLCILIGYKLVKCCH